MSKNRAKPAAYSLVFLLFLHAGQSGSGQQPAGPHATPGERFAEKSAAETGDTCRRGLAAGPARNLPIGVFDSGTGGLTVLEQILKLDSYNNDDSRIGSDGKPDFANESFVLQADQANMPYGNYPVAGKTRFLENLIVQDARFLLGTRFPAFAQGEARTGTKSPVKVIVIACNTATAYGKDDITCFLGDAGLDVDVIGVIDAGAKGAVEVFRGGGPGTVGVIATQGTVLSEAYPAAIRAIAKDAGIGSVIAVVQQGALGLAGAIDGNQEFIDRGVRDASPRPEYRGPSLVHPQARIQVGILPRYAFDFSRNGILFEGCPENPSALQLNTIENYIAYHVVTMLEKLRQSQHPKPLRAVVLGCTHFPFYADTFRRQLARLYDYQEDGTFVYRACMAEDVQIIDPAFHTARELYRALATDSKLRDHSPPQDLRARFYISVPYRRHPGVKLNSQGWFTYDYKYGRDVFNGPSDVRYVPLRGSVVGTETLQRLSERVPSVWDLLVDFERNCADANQAGRPPAGTLENE
jgi:glutamate racemase